MSKPQQILRTDSKCAEIMALAAALESCLHEITSSSANLNLDNLIFAHKPKETFSDWFGVDAARKTRNRIAHRPVPGQPPQPPLTETEIDRAKESFSKALRDVLHKCSPVLQEEILQEHPELSTTPAESKPSHGGPAVVESPSNFTVVIETQATKTDQNRPTEAQFLFNHSSVEVVKPMNGPDQIPAVNTPPPLPHDSSDTSSPVPAASIKPSGEPDQHINASANEQQEGPESPNQKTQSQNRQSYASGRSPAITNPRPRINDSPPQRPLRTVVPFPQPKLIWQKPNNIWYGLALALLLAAASAFWLRSPRPPEPDDATKIVKKHDYTPASRIERVPNSQPYWYMHIYGQDWFNTHVVVQPNHTVIIHGVHIDPPRPFVVDCGGGMHYKSKHGSDSLNEDVVLTRSQCLGLIKIKKAYDLGPEDDLQIQLELFIPEGRENITVQPEAPSVDTSTMSQITGEWKNPDPYDNFSRLTVGGTSSGHMFIHLWSKSRNASWEYDWGTAQATIKNYRPPTLEVTWDQGFVVRKQELMVEGWGRLKISTLSHFKDARPDKEITTIMVRGQQANVGSDNTADPPVVPPPDKTSPSTPPLVAAAATYNLVELEALLKNGAEVNMATEQGTTALHVAAARGEEQMIHLLLHAGANLNARIKTGATPLIFAVQTKHLNTVRILIEKGADINIRDWKGRTALAWAKQVGATEIVEFLIQNGAHI